MGWGCCKQETDFPWHCFVCPQRYMDASHVLMHELLGFVKHRGRCQALGRAFLPILFSLILTPCLPWYSWRAFARRHACPSILASLQKSRSFSSLNLINHRCSSQPAEGQPCYFGTWWSPSISCSLSFVSIWMRFSSLHTVSRRSRRLFSSWAISAADLPCCNGCCRAIQTISPVWTLPRFTLHRL